MLAALTVEARKLNRSLAALLAIAAPSLIAVFTFFNMLRGKAAMPWEMWLVSACGIWAFFMLPMSVTALTALVAHTEHGPRTWDALRALPVPRWHVHAAKACCVLGVVAAMSVWLMHAGWPFLQETKALLYMYPQVYADVSVINWIIPRAEFHDYLEALVRAGLTDRLMFGSDQMVWPEAITQAIEGVDSAPFLTPEDKRAIFHDNATRFLRLPAPEAATPTR